MLAAVMLLAGCEQAPQPVQPSPQPPTPSEMPDARLQQLVGDFKPGGEDYIGTLYLSGHARQIEMNEFFCGGEHDDRTDCKKYTYVFFDVDSGFDSENEAFKEFMGQNGSNSFAGGNSFSIGCLQPDSTIKRTNIIAQDEGIQNTETTIAFEDSREILIASTDAPVILKVGRKATPGTEAPNCYSHFSEIELVEIAPNV